MSPALNIFDAAMALVWLVCVVLVAPSLLVETATRLRQLCRRGPQPAPEAQTAAAGDAAEQIAIRINLHPATCERQVRRLSLLELSARSVAACLGLELTEAQRPPSVCYEFAALLGVGVISQADGEALLGAAMQIEATACPHRCGLCWLQQQLVQHVAAARRRAVYDYAAAPYGRPNV